MNSRIITHADFDGVVCAAMCSYFFETQNIYFTQPESIKSNRMNVNSRDIICDLPYHASCGTWFDHHPSNLEKMEFQGNNIENIYGHFSNAPSCARVILNYFTSPLVSEFRKKSIPNHFKILVEETDTFDSFDFNNIEDWLTPRPSRIINLAMRYNTKSKSQRNMFFQELSFRLRDTPIEQIAKMNDILSYYNMQNEMEKKITQIIKENISFHPEDKDKTLIFIDLQHLTNRKFPPMIIDKNLAYTQFPHAHAVVLLKPLTTNQKSYSKFSISASNAFTQTRKKIPVPNWGKIFRLLNIGDGHIGAAAGNIDTLNLAKKNVRMSNIKNKIFLEWSRQLK